MKVEVTIKVDGKVIKEHQREVGGVLEAMEEATHALGKEVARDSLQAALDNIKHPPRPLFSAEGGEMRHRGYACRTFVGLNGPITIKRARFQCSVTKKMHMPLDAVLDLPGGQVTVSVARRAMSLSTKFEFAQLEEEMMVQHEVSLTDTTLDCLMQAAGGTAVADREARLDALEAAPKGVQRERMVLPLNSSPAPKRLYVGCDGITYRTNLRQADANDSSLQRSVYQEMKVGAVFWQDARGKWHKQLTSGRGNPERFGLELWRLAVSCGMLEAEEVIFISDGGRWCNSVAELYFKDAVRILDWYHLSEHVWTAGRRLYPEDEKGAKGWVDACMGRLHDYSGVGLMLRLERCLKARGSEAAEALEPLLDYLRPRLAITDYVDYRKAGYTIGSGMIESSCKQVVAKRLKGSGMQWSEPGALAMTALVSVKLNDTWDAFWDTRPLQRAA